MPEKGFGPGSLREELFYARNLLETILPEYFLVVFAVTGGFPGKGGRFIQPRQVSSSGAILPGLQENIP